MIVDKIETMRRWPTTRQQLLNALRDPEMAMEAWQHFVDLYGPLVFQFCRRRRLQDADADDVTQQVFASLSRTFPRFEYDPSRGKFRSFLGTVVTNALRRHDRDQLRQKSLDVDYARQDPIDERQLVAEWEDECQEHLLQIALVRVEREYDSATWNVFEAVWKDQQRPLEVAQRMGCDVHQVYRIKYTVLKRLQQEIELLSEDLSSLNR